VKSSHYAAGVVMALLAGACLSCAGLILRHMEAPDGWQILFYRALTVILLMAAILAVRHRGRLAAPFRAIGLDGVVAGLSLATSMIAYVFSLLLTTVANAMFVISAAPFFTAGLGLLLLRERLRPLTWAAMAAAFGGIVVMFADGLVAGQVAGLLVALVCAATFAAMLVLMRRQRNVDMLPALILANALTVAVAAAMAPGLAASWHDVGLAVLLGVVQIGIGQLLMLQATRHVPAAEVSLLLLAEPILAPLWVWLAIGEAPTRIALLGGLIVLGAVVAQSVAGVLSERRAS